MFTKEFNNSLWCILEGDPAERQTIVDLLNRIPTELYKEIREVIEANAEFAQNSEEPIYLSGSFSTKLNHCYSYDITLDEQEKSIEISESMGNIEESQDAIKFSTSLTLVEETPPYDLKLDGYTWVGTLSYNMEIKNTAVSLETALENGFVPGIMIDENYFEVGNFLRAKEFEYNLVFGSPDHLTKLENGKESIELSPVDTSLIPDELSLEYINKRYSDNKQKEKKI